MMDKGFFTGLCLLFLALVLGVAVVFHVVSTDALRFQVETLIRDSGEIKARLERLEGKIARGVAANPATEVVSESNVAANAAYFDENAPDGGGIVSVIMADTKNMNSIINNDSTVSAFWDIAYSSLAARDYARPELFAPLMAESWSLSEDKLVYRIKLRRGMKWHDFTDPVSGKVWKDVEVKAQDFKFYVDVVKHPDTDCSPLRGYFEDLDRVAVLNDYEFEVHWKKRYFLSESITLGLLPLPRHFYHAYECAFDGKRFNDDHVRNRMIVGCGPYRFVSWGKGQRVIFERFEGYFGKELGIMPKTKTRVFELIKHPNTQFQALTAGKIDRLGLTPEQWTTRTDSPEFGEKGFLDKYKFPGRSYSYIGYNLNNPLFQDRRVRVALSHLINRDKILKDVLHGLARKVSGPFFIDSPYYDKSIKPYDFSLEKARALLAEAGWKDSDGDGILDRDGRKFSFTMMQVANSSTQQKILPIIKEDMARAGIEMNLQIIEWSVYVQRLESKSYDACNLAWSMGYESDPHQIWHSSTAGTPGSSNHIGFRNAGADKLIDEIRVTFDMTRRIELCHQLHRLLHEEQPYSFLFSPDNLLAQNRKYRNVRLFPLGIPTDIMWVPLEFQQHTQQR